MNCIEKQLQPQEEQQTLPIIIHQRFKPSGKRILPKLKSFKGMVPKPDFQEYQKGLKMLEVNASPILKIIKGRKEIPNRADRIKTEVDESERCQPVSPFFKDYIARSIARRKLCPLNLTPSDKQIASNDHYSPLHKPTKISLGCSELISPKIINLPMKHNRKQKNTNLKLKEKEHILNPIQSGSSHFLHGKSLELQYQFKRSNTNAVPLQKQPNEAVSAYLKIMQEKKTERQQKMPKECMRYEVTNQKGQILAPWSFYNENEHF